MLPLLLRASKSIPSPPGRPSRTVPLVDLTEISPFTARYVRSMPPEVVVYYP